MKRKILQIILFLIGVLSISYPLISNLVNLYDKTELVQEYQTNVSLLSEEEKQSELEKAIEYNKNLNNEGIVDISFSNRTNDNQYSSYLNILNIGNVLAYINIPKINVYLPIYHGVSDDVLQNGVGHLPETSLPIGGKGNYSVLAAHTGLSKVTMFDRIDELEIGDNFYIHVLDNVLKYEVDNIQVVEPTYQHVIERNENEDYVVLVTCTPRYVNTHRLLVRGKRVDEQNAENNDTELDVKSEIEIEVKNRKKKMYVGMITVCIIVVLGVSFLLMGKNEEKKGKHRK